MDFMLIDAKYKDVDLVKLNQDTLDYIKEKGYKVIALYGSVQFNSLLDKVIAQLKEINVEVISSQPARTDAHFQILGCDTSLASLNMPKEPDAFLYVGDGVFHPRALCLAQRNKTKETFKEIIRFDPTQNKKILMDINDIISILKKYKGSLIKFLSSKNIGVLITTKPGQQQYRPAIPLKEKYPEKNFYYFVENTLDFSRCEDFPFIDCWINTACPRIGFDDNANIPFSMVNLNDALNAEKVLGQESFLTKGE